MRKACTILTLHAGLPQFPCRTPSYPAFLLTRLPWLQQAVTCMTTWMMTTSGVHVYIRYSSARLQHLFTCMQPASGLEVRCGSIRRALRLIRRCARAVHPSASSSGAAAACVDGCAMSALQLADRCPPESPRSCAHCCCRLQAVLRIALTPGAHSCGCKRASRSLGSDAWWLAALLRLHGSTRRCLRPPGIGERHLH